MIDQEMCKRMIAGGNAVERYSNWMAGYSFQFTGLSGVDSFQGIDVDCISHGPVSIRS